jgi:Sap, sulfolipid-1-addressing protein
MAAELIPLAIASAFWPTLVAIVIISLRAPHPVRLLVAFLAGGLLTTVTIGLVVIYALQDSSLLTRDKSTTDWVVYVLGGVIALALAYALARRKPKERQRPSEQVDAPPGKMERMLARGVPIAFLAGIVLNVVPGVFPVIALKDIAELNYSVPLTVLTVLLFYVVMFAFIEVPLVAYLVAPARTASETVRFNDWLDRNSRRLLIYALAGFGALLIVRGIVAGLT